MNEKVSGKGKEASAKDTGISAKRKNGLCSSGILFPEQGAYPRNLPPGQRQQGEAVFGEGDEMSVYVDEEKNRYGRMMMCHMMADTPVELHAMARKIGVAQKWVQRSRTGILHYDICQSKRALAINHGAISVDRKFVGEFIKRYLERVKGEKSC